MYNKFIIELCYILFVFNKKKTPNDNYANMYKVIHIISKKLKNINEQNVFRYYL